MKQSGHHPEKFSPPESHAASAITRIPGATVFGSRRRHSTRQRKIEPAPCVVVRGLIGHRSTGKAELVPLTDHPVLPPADDAYRPDPAAMQWWVERLIA